MRQMAPILALLFLVACAAAGNPSAADDTRDFLSGDQLRATGASTVEIAVRELRPAWLSALSIICLDVFSWRTGAIGKVLWWSWAAAICLSTVLIHEHHVLDVVTGIILALGATRTIYPRVSGRAALVPFAREFCTFLCTLGRKEELKES